jgi:hypothetical protein
MFIHRSSNLGITVIAAGDAVPMANLFAIVGVVTVSLLGVARWWEER